APMAGGPSSVALLASVGAAGGLGVLPGGYLTAEAFDRRIVELQAVSDAPWAANLFLPGPRAPDPGAVAAHARALRPIADRHGVALGEPTWDDDGLEDKVRVLLDHRPVAITFTFGIPAAELVGRLRETTGAAILATATTAEEAARAEETGVDGLVLQGSEAGGHRGVHVDDPTDPAGGPLVPLVALVRRVAAETALPLVAAGGLHTGAGIRRILCSGASAVALGTALLATPEAGTSAVHRAAILERRYDETIITRGFTGRPARALANPLARAFPRAPSGYPEIHHVTRPLRAAAARAEDPDAVHLWAGEGWRAATTEPAGALVARLARDAGLD
ncbi:MAG: NAD(P)H-dependent flavin oxidoreductase, partial [Solirubrobacteraceae bacterium]